MTDAFAEASQKVAQQNAAPAASNTPAPESVKADLNFGIDNPFLTSSDVNTGGGSFGPQVPWEDIVGRLVVMVPQSFTEKSPKPEKFRKNAEDLYQPVADVDMFVLDGDPFTFEYSKPKEGSTTGEREYLTHTVEELPYSEIKRRIFSGPLAWTVKRAIDQRGILYGVFSYGPATLAEKSKGKTNASVTAEVTQWIQRGRKGERPRSTYVLDDSPENFTVARKKLAGEWWEEYRKTLSA